MRLGIICAILTMLAMLVPMGCQTMTPEQQAEAAKARATLNAATETLELAQKRLEGFVAEYDAIKARIDAGESIPAVLATRFVELQSLIVGATGDARAAVSAFQTAKAANDAAAAAGVLWYNRIDWWTIGKVGAGILCGIAGIWFPVALPAMNTARTVITAVGAVAKSDPGAGQMVKDAVLAVSRKNGNELAVDAAVQKYDPPSAGEL